MQDASFGPLLNDAVLPILGADDLDRQVKRLWLLWHRSPMQRSEVGVALPTLIQQAHSSIRSTEGDTRRKCRAAAADLYRLVQRHGVPEPLPQRAYTIGSLYCAAAEAADSSPLSRAEWTALHAFTRAAGAMELLGAMAEWHAGNHSGETAYLIDLGLAGLRDYRTA